MDLSQPIIFEPLFMERVWGGRRMEALFGKRLPPSERIGESWELVDREEAQSVVHQGPLRGATLHELWTKYRDEIFGPGLPDTARFPLLFKLLDAQERLSVQVHPPAGIASRLGGEPKTEMWYLLDAQPDAEIFAGLKRGVTRAEFERALDGGQVADLVHRIRVRSGEAILIPSGRIHAIGTGNLIFEVQQNSDTTYRVFDWNRLGLDGHARQLHVRESLESINFDDAEPAMAQTDGETLVECEWFRVEKWTLNTPRISDGKRFAVFLVLDGKVGCGGCEFEPGVLFLAPASLANREIKPIDGNASVLRTTVPEI